MAYFRASIFFQHLSHHQVLDLVIFDHNAQNSQKLMHFEQDNGLKPYFGPFLALNGPFLGHTFFFQKSENVTFLDLFQANLMQNKLRLNGPPSY